WRRRSVYRNPAHSSAPRVRDIVERVVRLYPAFRSWSSPFQEAILFAVERFPIFDRRSDSIWWWPSDKGVAWAIFGVSNCWRSRGWRIDGQRMVGAGHQDLHPHER